MTTEYTLSQETIDELTNLAQMIVTSQSADSQLVPMMYPVWVHAATNALELLDKDRANG